MMKNKNLCAQHDEMREMNEWWPLKPYGANEYEPVNKYVTVDIKQGVFGGVCKYWVSIVRKYVSIGVSIDVSIG